jgi:hopanoid biosynthesis associated radical SAM protein HpnH
MSVKECLDAVDECGAPVVAIPGGEPLIHKDIGEIVAGIVARKKFVSLCTNALLLEKKLDLFTPSPFLFFSGAVDQKGTFKIAVKAIKAAQEKGFQVNVNATIFNNMTAKQVADYLDFATDLGVNISISPGYAYERAEDQEHFLSRERTKNMFREVFRLGKERGREWNLSHSTLFLDFLAGNQEYHCTPWGSPTRNVFGWQKPCYLLGEGYVSSFRELMETTDWDQYGTGKYEKCANCMAHCGYEPTAAMDAVKNPFKMFKLSSMLKIKTEGPMAPEIDLTKARKAVNMHEKIVSEQMSKIEAEKKAAKEPAEVAA